MADKPTDATEDLGTYPAPEHGWTCFHCGDTFTTPGSARTHFGTTPVSKPGCQIKVGEERGLLMALRRLEDERDALLQERQRVEETDEAGSAQRQLDAVMRLIPGARTAHDVWAHLESLTGRVLAAEAVLVEIEAKDWPTALAARVAVCGPGTYYPMAEAAAVSRVGGRA